MIDSIEKKIWGDILGHTFGPGPSPIPITNF